MSEVNFELRIVNGLQGDPAVFVLIRRLGEALLFDLGSLEAMAHKDLLRVKNIFVSHTHMDHFIGFDRLLRVNVPHKRLLHIWGPAPFIDRVQAKLRAYTWNLIDDEQIRFQVSEIHADGKIEEALLSNTDDFEIRRKTSSQKLEHLCQFGDGTFVQAVVLNHKGTPSVAYRLAAPPRYRVLSERLLALHLKAGPWLSQLQTKLRQGCLNELLEVGGRNWSIAELARELIRVEPTHSLAYLTDFSFDRANLGRLRSGLGSTQQVICECSFLDRDQKRAIDKAHLTTRQSALLAAALGAELLHNFHVSGIYGQMPEIAAEEAQAFFEGLRGLDPLQLQGELEAELQGVERELQNQ